MVTTTVGTTPTGSEALPAELSRQFLALFPNRFDSSVRKGELGAWRQISRFHFLTDDEIISTLSGSSDLQRSFKLDVQNRFVVVNVLPNLADPDTTSRIHQRLNDKGLKAKLYKSAGEEHIYIFLSETIDCKFATNQLFEWCKANFSDSDFALVKVLTQSDSVPFPLQSGFSTTANSAQTKGAQFRSFLDDVNDGITPELFSNLLLVQSSIEEEIQPVERAAQMNSVDFWGIAESTVADKPISPYSSNADGDGHHLSGDVSDENEFELSLSLIAESRQLRQSTRIDAPNLQLELPEDSVISTTTESTTIFSVVNDAEPTKTMRCLSKEEPSRQRTCDQADEPASPDLVQLPKKVSRQTGKRSGQSLKPAQSGRVSDAVAVTPRKISKRSKANSTPQKESKQLSLMLAEQRETRAPP